MTRNIQQLTAFTQLYIFVKFKSTFVGKWTDMPLADLAPPPPSGDHGPNFVYDERIVRLLVSKMISG